MTFQTWIDTHLTSFPAKQFFRFMTNQGFSTEPEQISLLQMLWFFKTSHGLPPWALGGAQANRVEGGTGLVAIKMGEKIQNQIRYNEKVLQINQEKTFCTVHTEKNTYQAKSVTDLIYTVLSSTSLRFISLFCRFSNRQFYESISHL